MRIHLKCTKDCPYYVKIKDTRSSKGPTTYCSFKKGYLELVFRKRCIHPEANPNYKPQEIYEKHSQHPKNKSKNLENKLDEDI